MRGLIAMGLTSASPVSAAAQTEVIIRRPGQQDQVIQLDSAHAKVALEKAQVELKKMAADMQDRLKELRVEPTPHERPCAQGRRNQRRELHPP